MDTDDSRLPSFLDATASTFREMAGVEVVAVSTERAHEDPASEEFKALIRLLAVREGLLMLSLPSPAAADLARRILSVADVPPQSDLVADALGEVVNVIAGHAKAMLYGTPGHYTLGTPVVGTGPAATPGGERWVVEFRGEGLCFRIHLWMPGNGTVTP